MFVVGHGGRDVGRELERHIAEVGVARSLAKHDRRLALALDHHVVSNVTGR